MSLASSVFVLVIFCLGLTRAIDLAIRAFRALLTLRHRHVPSASDE